MVELRFNTGFVRHLIADIVLSGLQGPIKQGTPSIDPGLQISH